MPNYSVKCKKCGTTKIIVTPYEKLAEQLKKDKCICGAEFERNWSDNVTNFQLKGQGWSSDGY